MNDAMKLMASAKQVFSAVFTKMFVNSTTPDTPFTEIWRRAVEQMLSDPYTNLLLGLSIRAESEDEVIDTGVVFDKPRVDRERTELDLPPEVAEHYTGECVVIRIPVIVRRREKRGSDALVSADGRPLN